MSVVRRSDERAPGKQRNSMTGTWKASPGGDEVHSSLHGGLHRRGATGSPAGRHARPRAAPLRLRPGRSGTVQRRRDGGGRPKVMSGSGNTRWRAPRWTAPAGRWKRLPKGARRPRSRRTRGDAQGAVGPAVQGSSTTMPQSAKSPAFRVATAASRARAMAAIWQSASRIGRPRERRDAAIAA